MAIVMKKKQGKIVKKVVSSIIEITKSTTPEPIKSGVVVEVTAPKLREENGKVVVDARSLSLQQYHTDVGKMGGEIMKYAVGLSDNLLSVKMALMQAVREVEKKLQMNRREGVAK